MNGIAFTLAVGGFISVFSSSAMAQSTPYGNCPERAEHYQKLYESGGQTSNLVCMQKALEREMSGNAVSSAYDCPLSSQHYQTKYETLGGVSDLVCMQTALEREMR